MNNHNHSTKGRVIASGLVVATMAGVIAGVAFFGGSGGPAIASGQTHSAPLAFHDVAMDKSHGKPWHLGQIRQPTISHDVAPGGSQLKASKASKVSKVSKTSKTQAPTMQVGADEATQVHMSITNNTKEILNLNSASDGGGSVHWQGRATDLFPGKSETVNVYAATDAQINLTYTGFISGDVFQLMGKTPTVGSNQATGSSATTSYTVKTSAGSGYNPTDNYTIQAGQTFNGSNGASGQADTFVVPPGVTELQATVVGAPGGGNRFSYGAEVQGTMAVTSGEVLTVGAAGWGDWTDGKVTGGWGLTTGGMNFSGGDGTYASEGSVDAMPGGGASVVTDDSGHILVVAGGGGGEGAVGQLDQGRAGGAAGSGSWIGQNGFPFPGGGGLAGGSSSTQGQSSTAAGFFSGGAGGGGLNGGLSGMNGGGAGGGAGTSAAPGLTNATVQKATSGSNNPVTQTYITFAPVSS